jgi:hypothetical protein
MLVVIGIVILIVSFVIALLSLIAEERKRDRPQARVEKELPDQKDVKEREEDKVEQVRQILAKEEAKTAVLPSSDAKKSEPFPWETSHSETYESGKHRYGDSHKSGQAAQHEQVQPEEDVPLADARFPNLGEDQKTLSGSFRIGDISKKKD